MRRAGAGGYRKSKDDASRGPCIAALRAAGRQNFRLDGAAKECPGLPDDLIVWPGGWCLMEFKTGKAKLSDVQRAFWDSYRGPPGSLVLVRTPAEALRATGIKIA